MSKQRTAIEFDEKDKRFRAIMEQSSKEFTISDVPDALDCLLEFLGGRNIDVLRIVHDLLLARARSKFDTNSKTAEFLGMSRRRIHYDIVKRNALDANRILRDYKEEEKRLLVNMAEAEELKRLLGNEE